MPTRLQIALKWAGIGARKAVAAVSSAVLWLVVFALAGACSIVAGVYQLAGLGWAQVAAGLLLLMMAAHVQRGISNG